MHHLITDELQPAVHQDLHDLGDLRSQVTGALFTPDSPEWDQARMSWVLNVDQHPMAVLRAADAQDVVAAVRWAAAHGARIAVQASGHGAGHDLSDVLLVRTKALTEIEVDTDRRVARVGAGVTSGMLSQALAGTGLAFLVGSNPDPSVVGLTLTGGLSWFGRAFGLGSESIVGAEVVDGCGELRWIDESTDPELLWALRGGGGDFAVVTAVEVALHPAPAIHGGRIVWPAEMMREVMHAFREVSEQAPDEFTSWYHTMHFPPVPEVPEPMRGKSFAMVAFAHLGTAQEAEEVLRPFRAVPGVVMEQVGEVKVEDMADLADEPTDPMPAMLRSSLLRELDDATIERLVSVIGAGTQLPLMMLQVRHLGGALGRDTAGSHGPVDAPYNVQAIGVPMVPELVGPILAGLGQVLEAVAPVSAGRTLMNFLDHDQDNDWWDAATRTRLQQVKRVTDPGAIFVSNRPTSR